MSRCTRNPHSFSSEAKVALAAARGDSTLAELAESIETQHSQIGWRDKGAVPESGTRFFIVRQQPEELTPRASPL